MNRECCDECTKEVRERHLVLVKFDGDRGDYKFRLVDMGILGRGCKLDRDLVIVVVCATMRDL